MGRDQNLHGIQGQLSHNIIEKILQTTIPSNHIEDRMYWGPSTDGWFSTKSSINLIHKEKGHSPTRTDWIWKLNIPQKIKHFMWRIIKDGLPTKGKLEQRHISVPTQCEFCNQTYEDFYHLFVNCQNTRNIIRTIDPKIEKVLASLTNHNSYP